MADFSKRGPGCDDCEDGEGGERGERGERGRRGKRGPRGPGGPATSLVGPTEGPGAVVAGEDILIGSAIALGGSAKLAVGITIDNIVECGQTFKLCASGGICPPGSFCKVVRTSSGTFVVATCWPCRFAGDPLIGIASISSSVGDVVEYVSAGPIELTTSQWDAVTGGTGGLVPNTRYFLSQTTPGQMIINPGIGGTFQQVGIALSPTVMHVQIQDSLPGDLDAAGPPTSLKWSGSVTLDEQPHTLWLADVLSMSFDENRYPFASTRTAVRWIVRSQTNSLGVATVATVELRKNGGTVIDSVAAPSQSGNSGIRALNTIFTAPADDIGIALNVSARTTAGPEVLAVEVIVESV